MAADAVEDEAEAAHAGLTFPPPFCGEKQG